MAKSLVERYEQLLAQDPASSVFVELAKALVAKGEHARAIAVCEQGISHHPNSVTGRVLWGKALILMGRPAEAMAQFDQAVAIDKENPHAYNLIAEVLLQRGLYRSALPILRKALALQPNDGRVRGWMEQAQAALAGGPAPAFGDLNALEPQSAEEAAARAEGSEQAEASGSDASPDAAAAEAPQEPVLEALASEVVTAPAEPAPTPAPEDNSGPVLDLADVAIPDEALGVSAPEAAGSVDVSSILTAEVELPFDEEPPATPVEASSEAGSGGDAASEESTASGEGSLLADLPPLEEKRGPVLSPPPQALTERLTAAGNRRGLLEELPEATAENRVAPVPVAAPVARLPVQDVAALTAAYERELREKLLPKGTGTIFSGRTLKAMAAVGALVVLFGVFLVIRAKQGGEALAASLDHVARLIEKDMEPSRQEALSLLTHVVRLDEDNTRAWALTAYTHALRYADSGAAGERTQALDALNHPGVRAEQPGLALVVDVLVADTQGRDSARRALLGAKVETSEAQALAAGILLEQGKAKEALERFSRALKLSPRNVRALVSLGAYYRDAGDPVNALAVYTTAAKLAPEHPVARLGVAEGRLELGQELDSAFSDAQELARDPALPVSLRDRQRLVQGRLMTALGKARDARTLLAEGMKGPLAYETFLALGEANRAAGDMSAAQRAFEEALKLKPDSEDAMAGLGWAMLDRDREREVLTRVEGEGRQVALVRTAAYARLGDWKRVRVEVARTRVEDHYPPEAIVYLAQADAAEGERDRAREALEKTLAATKRAKAEVRTALGQMYLQDKALDKASSLFEAAVAEDARDYEAPCALGRLLISRGLPDLAMKPLTQAVERNAAHGEAREALGRALLALGRTNEALKQFEEWQLDNPGAATAHKGFAMALYHAGRMKDAEAASGRAVKLVANDPEAHRVRSDVLFALGDTKGGFGALENANRLDARSAETFCDIALAFLRQGLETNAEKAFEAARREGPDSPCGQVGEHWVKDSGGRAAAKALQAIADKAPTVWDKAFAQAAMARVLLTAGATKDARAAADEAVRLAPFSGRNHLVLGQVALKQRDEAAAMKALARAVELEPVDGLVWLAQADALVRNPAEVTRAVQAYQTFLKLAPASPEAGRVRKALPALVRRAGGR
ncbi:tetratricopeptide repeat protein [Archangium violaceum]|uniref:tetratricopeptide repeat protein n=1 Tax=Archangium violaceum TaxID=83451 RepID=UPI00194DDBC3|nr:tetratricopeptide repeat protein [Archangium violaceum]QRN94956.1 tetratricopeptide repeat protein [Archangium violaceum]